MSLIIASSAQGEFNFGSESSNVGSAIQKPYSFINHLSNTITVAADSEVAVTSVQMYKGSSYNITPAMKFYTYHGYDELSGVKLQDTNNSIVPVNVRPGKYSQRQMQNELQRALSESFGQHPDLNNRAGGGNACLVNKANSTDQPQSNPLSGFNFQVLQTVRTKYINIYPQVVPTYPVSLPVSALIQNCGRDFALSGCEVVNATGASFTLIRRKAAVPNTTAGPVFDEMAVCQLMDAPVPQNGTLGYVSPVATSVYDAAGSLCVDTSNAPGGWMVGLSRPTLSKGSVVAGVQLTLPTYRAPSRFRRLITPPGLAVGGESADFYDYVVVWRPVVAGVAGGGVVSLFHSVYDPALDSTRMVEIEYWGVGGTTSSPANQHTTVQVGTHPRVNYRIWNEQIQIYLNDGTGALNSGLCIMDTLVSPMATTLQPAAIDNQPWQDLGLRRAAKPTNQNTQALYPKFQVVVANEYLELVRQEANCAIDNTHGRGPYSYNYPIIPDVGARAWQPPPGIAGGETGVGSTWWARVLKNKDPFYARQAAAMDTRDSQNITRNTVAGDVIVPYRGMDLTTVGAVFNEAKAYSYGLIIQATQPGAQTDEVGVFPNDAYGFRGILGFGQGSGAGFGMTGLETNVSGQILAPIADTAVLPDGVGVLTDTNDTAPSSNAIIGPTSAFAKWKFQSSSPPSHIGGTAFVKCSSLTHQSYNFSKSLPSKILWQIPKFGGDGNSDMGSDTGALYFENSSPIYLDLKNPNPLVLNELHIEIVDKNERFVDDLTGPTTLTLHIRPKR